MCFCKYPAGTLGNSSSSVINDIYIHDVHVNISMNINFKGSGWIILEIKNEVVYRSGIFNGIKYIYARTRKSHRFSSTES